MRLRFLTLLLILAMLFPAGVFGAVLHRCGMEKSASSMSCCQGTENNRPEGDGFDQWTHHCQWAASKSPSQLATVSQKVQFDAAHLADIRTTPSFFLRLTEGIFKTLRYQVASHPPGGSAPVFIRVCSFLI